MAKSKKNRTSRATNTANNNPSNLPTETSAAKPVVVAKKAATTPRKWGWLGGALGIVGLLTAGVVGFWLLFQPQPQTSAPDNRATPSGSGSTNRIGGVTCVEKPEFTQSLQFSKSAIFSTSQRGYKGLVLIEPAQTNPRIYQHPSWASAGYLAPIESGNKGEVFVAPAPVINVLDNPPEQQNQVYRVEPAGGVMSQFVALPPAAPPNENNPFGVMGLGYDCENFNLYVSSVAGSNRSSEVGRIFRVDTRKKTIEAQLEKTDAIGLVVFNGAKGKRLYYGLARLPEIWSVGLDSAGNFVGQPRKEISLANLGQRGSDKVRDIKFNSENQMEVHGIEFSFNLIAPTEKLETIYLFNYNRENDSWVQAGI